MLSFKKRPLPKPEDLSFVKKVSAFSCAPTKGANGESPISNLVPSRQVIARQLYYDAKAALTLLAISPEHSANAGHLNMWECLCLKARRTRFLQRRTGLCCLSSFRYLRQHLLLLTARVTGDAGCVVVVVCGVVYNAEVRLQLGSSSSSWLCIFGKDLLLTSTASLN